MLLVTCTKYNSLQHLTVKYLLTNNAVQEIELSYPFIFFWKLGRKIIWMILTVRVWLVGCDHGQWQAQQQIRRVTEPARPVAQLHTHTHLKMIPGL
jgi:hypothetical protein